MAGKEPSLVTGISPKEGPPGTKVTIRGERLGKGQNDLVKVEICGVDCILTAEWVSPNKILCRTLLCKGRGDIVIVTKSGGQGTSTVQFRGYQETVGPTKESAVWVEETVPLGPRQLSMSTYQQEDPLQISVEGNEKKFPVEELLEMFPEGSGNLRSENFMPAWFLLENHHATKFEDLKAGLHCLNRKVGSQTEGKLSFLKENITSIIDQLDALVNLRDKCNQHKKKHGGNFISQIDDQITVCEREAGKLFQEVLARKDRADVTRNALSVYQRFRFLLSLPGTIEKSIEKGEFDTAISDYTRAKALFEQPETDKPIFRKFRLEVESRVNKLREILRIKLLEKPPNSEEQRVLIGHLKILECDYDPAWLSLKSHYDFITNTMKSCFNQFSSVEKSTPRDFLRTPSSKQDPQNSYPNQVSFIESLSDIFINCFPDFWNLGQDYFGSKLQIKPDLGKQVDMKNMMVNIVKLFSNLVSACLLPNSNQQGKKSDYVWNDKSSESMSEWLPHCLNDIRDAFTELLSLDPPREMIDILRNLLFNIRVHSLEVMIHQMGIEVSNLYKQESWTSEPFGNYGFITTLPTKFESQITSSAKVIKETLLQKYIEEIELLKNEDVRNALRNNFGNALGAYSDTLELLISKSRELSKSSNKVTEYSTNNGFDSILNGTGTITKRGVNINHSVCLLLILNNCSYTKDIILTQIHKSLQKMGYPEMPMSIEKAKIAINGVENLTFAKYIEMKYEPVVGQIEQAMYSCYFDWEKCPEPKAVKPYITKALLGMIEIISEVTSVSEKLIYTVMVQVVENVCEELTRLFSCVPKFNENGSIQATLDLAAFQDAISSFLTPNSRSLIKEAFNQIPRSNEFLRNRKLQSLLDEHKGRSKMQYLCFSSSPSRC